MSGDLKKEYTHTHTQKGIHTMTNETTKNVWHNLTEASERKRSWLNNFVKQCFEEQLFGWRPKKYI